MSIKDRLLKVLRHIHWIDDKLNFRDAKSESDALYIRLQNGLAAAKEKSATSTDLENIRGQFRAEQEYIWDPIYARESDKLVQRARKHHVRIPPLPNDHVGNDDWHISYATGDYFLTDEGERRLKSDVVEVERKSYDEFRKWAGVVLAISAFVLALVSLKMKTKQPDPCPKNYYRADSGECVFAFQKTPPPQSVPKELPSPVKQAPPATSKP
jgi:hypothetical protein